MTDQDEYTNNIISPVAKKIAVASFGGGPTNIENIFLEGSRASQTTGLPNNVPRSQVTDFIGRKEELEQLHEQLMLPYCASALALSGTGGVGKTELVIQYALRYQEEYQGGICWLLARDSDIGSQLVKFARSSLGINLPKESDLQNKLAICWSSWRKGNVLLVFDDVTDFYRIQPYLPPARPRFKVLITTRLQYGLPGIKFIELRVLSEPVALELLRATLLEEDPRLDEEVELAQELCLWLDYLPLGLELVGRYLARKQDLSLSEMLERLYSKKLSQEAFKEKGGISAAIELSWQDLNEEAKTLGYFLSLFAIAPIPWWLVEQLQGEQTSEELEELRDDWLCKFSLLQRQESGFYQFPNLVREFIQNKLNQSAGASKIKKSFCQQIVNFLEQLFGEEVPPEAETIPIIPFIVHLEEMETSFSYLMDERELFISHISLLGFYIYLGIYTKAAYWGEECESEMTSRLGREHPDVVFNRYLLAQVYLSQGNFRKAEQYLVELEELGRNVFGDEDTFVAQVLSALGTLRAIQGHFEEAKNYCREALELEEKLLGEDNPEIASSLSALADVCRMQGHYEEAGTLYDRLFEFKEEEIQDFLINNPTVCINISELYLEQGCTDDAEKSCNYAKEIVEETLDDEHPLYAICLSNLANVYMFQGRYQEAEICCQTAIEINQGKGIIEHPTNAMSLVNLADIYTAQERLDDAEILYEQALEIYQLVFGRENIQVAETLVNCAINYVAQDNYKDAETLLIQGQKIYQSTLGTNYPQYSDLLSTLAEVRFNQNEYDRAEKLLLEAVKIVEVAFGEIHPKSGEKLADLACFLISQKRYQEAEPLFERSLKIAQQIFGKDNPNVCQYMLYIAELYYSYGRESEAESFYANAIGIYEKNEKVNPDFSEGLLALIELYQSQRRYEEVDALYERLLKTCRRLLGNEHPKVVQLLTQQARLREEQWRYEEAAQLHEEALKIRQKIFNKNHPSIATNLVNLAYDYQRLNQFDEAQKSYQQALKIRSDVYGDSHEQVQRLQKALASLKFSWDKYRKSHPQNAVDTKKLEPVLDEQQSSERAEVLRREIADQSEAVALKASEIEAFERQKVELKAKLVRLQEQQTILEADIEQYKQNHQLQQSGGVLTAAKELIRLTREERAKLFEPLKVVLDDLEQQRKDYQQTWEKLQTAIQQFNKYREETDEIYVHLDRHYQADCTLSQRLLPLDSKKVEHILQIIRTHLDELDKELAQARTRHERSQQKSIVTF